MNGAIDVPFEGPDSSSADLSSWDILQDLEFLGNPAASNVMPAAEGVQSQPSSKERLKEKNRQAQKRARQKKKVGRNSLNCS